jgi:hypothetical protein
MKHFRITFFVAFLLASCVSIEAQTEPLNQDWFAEDLEGVSELLRLLPFEKQNIEAVKTKLRSEWSVEESDLGFGGRYLSLGKGNGYTKEYVNALLYNGRVAKYEAGIESFSNEWPQIKQSIERKWKDSKGPSASLEEHGLVSRQNFDSILREYQNRLAFHLGPLKATSVPPALATAYDELTNPMNNATISGTHRSSEIDALVEAQKLDLLENVLKGGNPGARVLAALAFLELKRNGAVVRGGTLRAADTVLKLPIELHACVFDMCSRLKAADVLVWFKSDKAFPEPIPKRRRS